MDFTAKKIWLPGESFPEYVKTPRTRFCDDRDSGNFCVADFKKSFSFPLKKISSLRVSVYGDTFFRLFVNGKFIGLGPASAGGDFEDKGGSSVYYANHYDVSVDSNEVNIFAEVQLTPAALTQISFGRGCFALCGELIYDDGTSEKIETDNTWLCRLDRRYKDFAVYDGSVSPSPWENAEEVGYDADIRTAPVPMLEFEKITPDGGTVTLKPHEKKSVKFEFDKIYSAHLCLCGKAKGLKITADITEFGNVKSGTEKLLFSSGFDYSGLRYYSVSELTLELDNFSDSDAEISVSLLFRHYPFGDKNAVGSFRTSDEALNKIYDVCVWTLGICRQTLHLDSPKHQEPLACTGDYNIEAMMTAVSYGDMRLAKLDVMRTADIITRRGGVMFHTTYSLIWVQMFKDVYMFTGDFALLRYCEKALHTLLERFSSYLGENGLIDNPPDYMFVDWVVADGFSMHHPPKNLGQTVLNAFYHNALDVAAELFDILGDTASAKKYRIISKNHKKAYNDLLFDKNRGLYVDGLTDKTPEEKLKYYLPQSNGKTYFSKHANILSVLCGLCDGKRAGDIMRKVMTEEFITDLQPYFMHYLFEALKKCGMYDEYFIPQINRWSVMTNACDKGLQEGWYKPEETYSFDHSHAWGGTAAYQLPTAFTGFEMLEPGYKKIRLSPKLYGLDFADIDLPTPYGKISVRLKNGEMPEISAPAEIEIVM